jgi:catechol 2,3-dioxygenase-like lactoylglutathione lyase family enzyme
MIASRRRVVLGATAAALPWAAAAQGPAAAKLKRIKAATVATPDVSAAARWYAGALGYRIAERNVISPALAAAWGAPAMAGRTMVTLLPESGADVPIRIVEIDPMPAPEPLTTWGWSAIEIAVQDVDALYARLKRGWLAPPIRLLGEPRALSPGSPIVAMQLRGPAGEVLYLTANTGDRLKSNHPEPRSMVDRTFIAVLAGPDLAALKTFYRDRFALGDQGDMTLPVPSRAVAHGLPADHPYTISVVVLAERGNKIELDGFPPGATGPRPQWPGQLPPGTAMMSFSVAGFDGLDGATIAPPAALYGSLRAATFRGPAGELTELIADRS